MPTTPALLLPYPAPTASPDVPYDLQRLAERVETVLISAWTTLTLGSGWAAVGGYTPQARRVGGLVYVRGMATTTKVTNWATTLPVEMRPTATQVAGVAVTDGGIVVQLFVDPSGTYGHSSGGYISGTIPSGATVSLAGCFHL